MHHIIAFMKTNRNVISEICIIYLYMEIKLFILSYITDKWVVGLVFILLNIFLPM
jgi:hypothetical protein